MVIREWQPADTAAVIALIVGIQREEFDIAITAADQPDLVDVPGFYQRGAGNFWVAWDAGVVGTVGLRDIGDRTVALRKMFVSRTHRGRERGTAQRLLDTALEWAAGRGVQRVMLGTTDAFRAAHRFYERNLFTQLAPEALPPAFPRMAVDTRFYVRHLS